MTHTIDGISYSIIFAAVFNLLPPLAALISLMWIGFQFYYHPQVIAWRKRRKEQKDVAHSPDGTNR